VLQYGEQTMTRKDYQKIASFILDRANEYVLEKKFPMSKLSDRESPEFIELCGFVDGISYTVGALCSAFKDDNPNFKADKFIEACGLSVDRVDYEVSK
jgi:hypothetical protein